MELLVHRGGLYGFSGCGPQATSFSLVSEYESGVFAGGQVQVQLYAWVGRANGDGYLFVDETLRARMAP